MKRDILTGEMRPKTPIDVEYERQAQFTLRWQLALVGGFVLVALAIATVGWIAVLAIGGAL